MPPKNPKQFDLSQIASNLPGFASLRPGQEDALRSLLDGRDTLFIAPDGTGKSAVWRMAGRLMKGVAVVVSPDWPRRNAPDEIQENEIQADEAHADEAHADEIQADEAHADETKFVLLAPEQLRDRETIGRLKAAGVTLFAVDEAHCVSRWDHEFNPDYLELADAIEALGHPVTLATTATAMQEVRAEIVERLGMRDPRVIVRGFDRPNLYLRVDSFSSQNEKIEAVLRRVEFADKPGIVYVATHHHAESLAEDLRDRGVDALAYHGGMKAKARDDIQERFMSGDAPVIVATNAFGMGVDKPGVRFVYHADASESLDGYYQEIGRAGRDGEPAEAVLFYRPHDISAQRYKTGAGRVDAQQLESVANLLTKRRAAKTPERLSRETGLSPRKLTNILRKFKQAGAAHKLVAGRIHVESERSAAEIAGAAARQQEMLKQARGRRLEQMRSYAETRGCRREYLLRYFGEEFNGPCGNCDRCEAAAALWARRA